MNVHHELDAILENIINEHKNNGELGGEGLFAALLRLKKKGGLQFPVTNDNIKDIVYDVFAAGTETSSTIINWATVEMMKNPSVLANAQAEVNKISFELITLRFYHGGELNNGKCVLYVRMPKCSNLKEIRSDKDTIDISKRLGNGQVLEVFVCHIVGEPELAPLLKFVSDGEGHVEGESGLYFNKDIGTINRASKNRENALPFDQPTAHTSSPPTVQPTAHTFPFFVQPNSYISYLPTDQPNAYASFPIVVTPSSSTAAPSSSTVAPTNSHVAPSESIVDSDVESIDGGVEIGSDVDEYIDEDLSSLREGKKKRKKKKKGRETSGDRNSLKGKLAGDEPCYLSDEASNFETNSNDVTDEEDEIE
ncbi:Cytochrome 71D6 [Capsicum baccatum]|uniref:Cytochrome 71D6 n=1 Tax=Capsicum baccatum TaxID=33114 RepID=A0A2G2XNR8_CAPBA|nr:Cytochrome 71D6 [Capsicum baccatum]